MSMTIQSSVKDKILATPSETSKVENAPAEMLRDMDQQMEKRADDGKANVVTDALSRKERVKPRRVRAMAMTIQYGVREMILTAQSEAFKQENVPLVGSEMDEAHASRLRWMIYPVLLADAAESVRDAIGFEYCLASSSGWTKAEIGESSLTGPELVLDTTNKVVLIKEKLKSARDRQKSYADKRRKPLEFEVGDRVLLKVSPWKGVNSLYRRHCVVMISHDVTPRVSALAGCDNPREPHFAALKRILRYVRGTVDFGLQLYVSDTTSLVGYTDADWAGCPSTRRSTSGYYVFLGDNLLSWSAKRQHTISRSSAEAKCRVVANVVAETAWVRNLLRELHSPLMTATLVYCDNVSAVFMSANPVQHQQTKHIEIDIHFVRDMVTAGHVRVLHVSSRFQFTDIFTKGLPSALFEDFHSSLSVRPPPARTAGAY
ncbi:ribonuclease H-like domain-containing protein [Tanacetum coccineum]